MSSIKLVCFVIFLVVISMIDVNAWRRRRRVCCKRKKKDGMEDGRSTWNSRLPSNLCRKEGLYTEEEGHLTPTPDSTEIPIECNSVYCRSINHLHRSITCWKCRINSDEFVTIDRENQKEIQCSVRSIGSSASDELEEEESLDL